MTTRWRPTSKALFSGLFWTSELQLERMTSYYTGTGDVTRSKLASTWESKPLYYATRSLECIDNIHFNDNRIYSVHFYIMKNQCQITDISLPTAVNLLTVLSCLFTIKEDNSLKLAWDRLFITGYISVWALSFYRSYNVTPNLLLTDL